MKFVDLSGDSPKSVTVLTLQEIAAKVAGSSGYSSWSLKSMLEEWIENPEITTPAADFTIDEVEYWKPERVADWQSLYDKEIQREEDRKAAKLAKGTVTYEKMIAELLEHADLVRTRNARCYSHNRGNSYADGRRRVIELQGKIDFVEKLLSLGDVQMTKEQRTKLNDFVRQAKSDVKMQ